MDLSRSDQPGRNPADLRHSISTLRAMVEACPLAMLALDLDGVVRLWSRGAEQMFGWTEEEALGRPLPFAHRLLETQLLRDSGPDNELTWPRKNGDPLHVSFQAAP